MEKKQFNLSEKMINASEEKTVNAKIYGSVIPTKDVKEFIKRDWVLTNHFLWDLFRKWEVDEDVIEEEITKLYNKKTKIAGEKLR